MLEHKENGSQQEQKKKKKPNQIGLGRYVLYVLNVLCVVCVYAYVYVHENMQMDGICLQLSFNEVPKVFNFITKLETVCWLLIQLIRFARMRWKR